MSLFRLCLCASVASLALWGCNNPASSVLQEAENTDEQVAAAGIADAAAANIRMEIENFGSIPRISPLTKGTGGVPSNQFSNSKGRYCSSDGIKGCQSKFTGASGAYKIQFRWYDKNTHNKNGYYRVVINRGSETITDKKWYGNSIFTGWYTQDIGTLSINNGDIIKVFAKRAGQKDPAIMDYIDFLGQSSSNVVVDAAFDDNRNNLGFDWYYYDDNYGVFENDRPQAAPSSVPSIISAPFTTIPRHAFGDTTDDYPIRSYSFVTGLENSNCFCTVPFTFGDNWPTSWDPNNVQDKAFIGVGTKLCADGQAHDLTGAYAIKFRIRSTEPSVIRFIIQTKEIDDISYVPASQLDGDEFGYYGIYFEGTSEWSEVTVKIDDLSLPGTWAAPIDFNIASCTRLTWEISNSSNPAISSSVIDVDDIEILY